MNRKQFLVEELRSLVRQVISERFPPSITLDELGDLIGDRAITAKEIEDLISLLEGDGVRIGGDEAIDLEGLLRTVLETASSLKQRRSPLGPRAIAEESGMSLGAVKLALLYSEVIRKPS